MGYQYGNWNTKYICSLDKITERKLRSYIKKGELGNFIWNNVRMTYKISMNIHQIPELQQYTLDYGFEQLKNINLHIVPNETIIIKGSIGSGKSTLSKLILKLLNFP